MKTMKKMLEQLSLQQKELIELRKEASKATGKLPGKVKPVQPEVFRGERSSATVEAWLHTVDKYGELTGIQDEQRILFASTLLRDAAATWWRHIESTVDERTKKNLVPTVWEDFKEMFRKEFKPSNAAQLARQRLQRLEQTTSIREYIVEFRDIKLDLPDMKDEDSIHQFVRGLKYDARLQVLLARPTSLMEAYNAAESFESAWECAQGVKEYSARTTQEYELPPGEPMDLDAIRTYRPQGRRYNPGQQKTRSAHPHTYRRCYNCGGQGHIAVDCPSPPMSNNRTRENYPQQRSNLKVHARRD